MKNTIVLTGCDAKFYPYMEECLLSLLDMGIDGKADIAILDLGLSADQIAKLSSMGFMVKTPTWPDYVPESLRAPFYNIGLVARTALRDYFPGYSVYLWFDADAWAQTPEFFDALVDGARARGAAVIREDGANYKRDLMYSKWWFGNMIKSYGVKDGIGVCVNPTINIGVMALSDKARHWNEWIELYKKSICNTNKINMDQHAFNYSIDKHKTEHSKLDAIHNWLPSLSVPKYDEENKRLVSPDKKVISVIHLAGPNKDKVYNIRTLSGDTLQTPLTYKSIKGLKN